MNRVKSLSRNMIASPHHLRQCFPKSRFAQRPSAITCGALLDPESGKLGAGLQQWGPDCAMGGVALWDAPWNSAKPLDSQNSPSGQREASFTGIEQPLEKGA